MLWLASVISEHISRSVLLSNNVPSLYKKCFLLLFFIFYCFCFVLEPTLRGATYIRFLTRNVFHTHTHTLTLFHSLSLSLSHTHTNTDRLIQSHIHTHIHSHKHTRIHTETYSHTHRDLFTHTYTDLYTHSYTLIHSLSQVHTHTHNTQNTHTLRHTRQYSETYTHFDICTQFLQPSQVFMESALQLAEVSVYIHGKLPATCLLL